MMLTITTMFLIGLLFGWFTGFNLYRIIFVEVVLLTIFFILINIEISVTGDATASVAALQNTASSGSTILNILSGVVGMFSGMYLKHKSIQMEEFMNENK